MITEVDAAAAEFHKRAENAAEAEHLRQEALVLIAAQHPGVVHLLGSSDGALRLRLVDGILASTTSGIAVALATTLADLHEIGVVHGALRPEHILVDQSGLPVLCSLGYGRTGVDPGGPEAAADVAALATVLLAGTDDPTQQRVLTAATTARSAPNARQLAHRLALAPPPSGRQQARRLASTPGSRRVRRSAGNGWNRRAVGVAAVVAVAVVVVGWVAATILMRRAHPSADDARPTPAATCPAVDRGCLPIPDPGVLQVATGRYRIGGPGDVLVLGRWHCRSALPALLEPSTGELWVFDSWAVPGTARPARLLARVPGAVTLRVVPAPSGCDALRVTGRRGAGIVVHPGARP